MRRLHTAVLVFLGLFLVAGTKPARAQGTATELSAGWRVLHVEDETFLKGWYADVVGNITDTFGVVGEVGGHYKTVEETEVFGSVQAKVSASARVHTFMGGVRFTARQNPRLFPFAQALFGLAHGAVDVEGSTTIGGQTFTVDESESSSDMAVDLGGGVNILITNGMGLRLAGSYLRILEEDAGNAARFAIGLTFPF